MNHSALQQQFNEAVQRYLGLKSRNADDATLTAALKEAEALKARLDRGGGDDAFSAAFNKLAAGMGTPGRGGARGNSVGHQFIASETFEFLKKNRGKFPAGAWTSPTSELMGGDMMAATLSEDAASGGDLVVTDNQPGIVQLPQRPLRLEQLIRPGQTDSNTIGYMKETAFTNEAALVAEGDAKPESTLNFENVTDPVRKIAHWLPVTDEMLEDVPALRSYIDARLRLGVNLALDDELLNGAATGTHITGLLNRTGLASAVVRTGTVTNADAILEQIVAIETATNMEVDGIVMNMTNWKTVIMSKDGEGRYYGGGPLASPARPVLWGRPVAITSAIVANTALVGAFGTAAQLFNRGGMRVEASNSHENFFIRNLLAIRAERRVALAVYRPAAFGVVSSLT